MKPRIPGEFAPGWLTTSTIIQPNLMKTLPSPPWGEGRAQRRLGVPEKCC